MMKTQNLFAKHRTRFIVQGVLKSLLCGLIIGGGVTFVVAFITVWFKYYNGLGISLALGAASFVISALIFYFAKFRPAIRNMARSMDALGLEERLITMLELEGDDSYIAQRQRADATAKLQAFDTKKVKFGVVRLLVITVSAVILAAGMTVTTALLTKERPDLPPDDPAQGDQSGGEDDPNNPGSEIKEPQRYEYVEVRYLAQGGGRVIGDSFQVLRKGSLPNLTSIVVPVADNGWAFYGWSDEIEAAQEDENVTIETIERQDKNVEENLTVIAVFVEVPDGGSGGSGSGDGNQDSSPDQPPVKDENDNSGGGGGTGPSGEGNPGGSGAGSGYEDNSQIIDGETYYKDLYEEYLRQAQAILAAGGEIPDELRRIIELYFGAL